MGSARRFASSRLGALRAFAALLATFATCAPIAHVEHLGDGFITLGVGLSLLLGRRATEGRLWTTAVRLPLVTAGAIGCGYLLRDSRPAFDALFILAVVAAVMSSRLERRVAAVARTLTAPLLALLVVPAQGLGTPLHTLGWSIVAGLIADGWVLVSRIGTPQEAREAVARKPPLGILLRMAAHRAVGLALAFTVGQVFFSQHWTWTVITAYTVISATSSRGEVVFKGVQRLGGALAGSLIATPISIAFEDHRRLSVAAIFVLLAVGLTFRDRLYAVWAGSVTGVLALLYALLGQPASVLLLGERLLEIALGGIIVAIPACLIAPLRTREVVRRRTGVALLAIRAVFESAPEHQPAAVRGADDSLEQLRAAAAPLLAVHRVRPGPEGEQARKLLTARPVLWRLDHDTTATAELRAIQREVGLAYRASG